jgi:hypothetical protein
MPTRLHGVITQKAVVLDFLFTVNQQEDQREIFFKIYCQEIRKQKIYKIIPLTNLLELSFAGRVWKYPPR